MTAPADAPLASRRARVLLPLPLAGPYDYAVPDLLTLEPGDHVRVPLGPREHVGVVWDAAVDDRPAPPDARLKAILARYDAPPMPAVLRRFVDWVARYTVTPQGAVLRLALRGPQVFEPAPSRTAYGLAASPPERLTPARRRVLSVLADGLPRPAGLLASEAAVGPGVVRGLIEAGVLAAIPLPADAPVPEPRPGPGRALTPDQAAAGAALRAAIGQGYAAFLLDGVTGSGKTEVYFEAIAELLEGPGHALILLPEIALTVQFLDRFAARFGCRPAEWHSDLSAGERRRTWRAVAEGRARVVVGARSALFLPYPDLRLIVVDEEHERAYKQEDGVIYHARDMAVARAKLGLCPIVLASATPSLESLTNVAAGRYRHLVLPDRVGVARLPEIVPLDLRETPPEPGRWLAPPLVTALGATLAAGEQSLLFLNRRGYAPLTLCRRCGHRLACPDCRTWLVEHRFRRRLACHHCGYERAPPEACPACGAPESLVPCGPGVERVAEEVRHLFPTARVSILSSDSLPGPRALGEALDAIEAGRVDIIVGTQLVAKGHHFPALTLVGVVDADLGLEGGDLRAAERTFQLVSQVAGRAGRAARPGRALLQTYQPDHPVLAAIAAGDRAAFLAREAAARRQLGFPPFGKLAALIVSGPDEGQVARTARALARTAPPDSEVQVLGPAPAPLAVLRGRFRQRLLAKAARSVDLSACVARWVARVRPPGSVRIAVDIDPYSFL